MGSSFFKLVFLCNTDEITVDTELVREIPNTDIWPIVRFKELNNYLTEYFPSIKPHNIRIITPHKLLRLSSNKQNLSIVTENYFYKYHLKYQKLIYSYGLMGPIQVPPLNENLLNGLVKLIKNELGISITKTFQDLIQTHIKSTEIDTIIEILTYQKQILNSTSSKNETTHLFNQFHKKIQHTSSRVIQILLATFLYDNDVYIDFNKIVDILFNINLNEDDLRLMDIFAPIYHKLSLKHSYENILLKSFDLINSTIAHASYIYSDVKKHNIIYFHLSAAILTKSSSTNDLDKANIYNTVINYLKYNFEQSIVKYFYKEAYDKYNYLIAQKTQYNRERVAGFLHNFVNYFGYLPGNKSLVEYLCNNLRRSDINYSELYTTWSVLHNEGHVHENQFNKIEYRVVNYHSILLKMLDSKNVNYVDIQSYRQTLSILKNCHDHLDKNHRFQDQIMYKQMVQSLKYYDGMKILFDPVSELPEIIDTVISLTKALRNEVNYVSQPLKLQLQELILGYIVQNLSSIDKEPVYALLHELDLLPIVHNQISPSSLLVRLIKAQYDDYKLGKIELQYVRQVGLEISEYREINKIIDLIEEFYIHFQLEKSFHKPVMTVISSNKGEQVILNKEDMLQTYDFAENVLKSKLLHFEDHATIQYVINHVKRLQDTDNSIELLQSISNLFEIVDTEELTDIRFNYPEIHDQISYYQELSTCYFNTNNTTLAFITIEKALDLAKSFDKVRRSDWLKMIHQKIHYLQDLKLETAEYEELLELIKNTKISKIPNLIN